MDLRGTAGGSVGAGAATALSLPPWGWWPLGAAGLAGLAHLLARRSAAARLVVGAGFALGMFVPGLWWVGEFSRPGAVLVVLLQSAFVAGAALATPPGRGRAVALPAALVAAEAARGAVPFGGLPMAGAALGQAGGPLAGAARVGGPLLVLALVAAAGVGLAGAAGRRRLAAVAGLGLAVAGGGLGAVAPDGGDGTTIDAAVVQGGGDRGFQSAGSDPEVFARHLATSEDLRPPLDVVLWPEDVVDVDGPITAAPEAADLAALARRLGATVVAGVVEGAGPGRFRNAAVAWSADGRVADRFDKVRRVPFGEYVPGRRYFDRLADLSAVPRDAIAGRGPGLLRTPAGDLGVLVSYEVFFAHRARGAVGAGGRLLLVPTNAASFSTSQVPGQELAAARLRAIETGRDLLQAAPTGYSAVVDHRGRLRARTGLGDRRVHHARVELRGGRTLYARSGDGPVLALAALGLVAAWTLERRSAPRPPATDRAGPPA